MAAGDRVRGVLIGQAVGDALGLGAEFLSKREVAILYPTGLRRYGDIIYDAHRSRWLPGDWTDDTDQMLCILDSLLDHGRIDVRDIARRLFEWMQHGLAEFGDVAGLGIGRTVGAVLRHPGFLTDPHAAAEMVWRETGVASNGAVMRTAAIGLFERNDLARVSDAAARVCRITHFDPRCVASCVAVCVAIARLVDGASVDEAVRTAVDSAAGYDSRVGDYVDVGLDTLDLDEGLAPGEPNVTGYTYKALGAGFWALRHAPSYLEGVLAVIAEGGDADTNAAVAGALLGARDGVGAIPPDLIEGLRYRAALDRRAAQVPASAA